MVRVTTDRFLILGLATVIVALAHRHGVIAGLTSSLRHRGRVSLLAGTRVALAFGLMQFTAMWLSFLPAFANR